MVLRGIEGERIGFERRRDRGAVQNGATKKGRERREGVGRKGSAGGASGEECRGKSSEEGGEDGGREGEEGHRPADVELVQAGNVRRECGAESLGGPEGDQEGAGARGQGDEERFDGLLTEESGARGTDGGADGEFAATGPAASEEEIADVGASDEKNEADGAEENGERSLSVTEKKLAERGGVNGPVLVDVWIGGGEASGDGAEFSIGGGEGGVGLEAGDYGIGVLAAIGELFFGGNESGEELGVRGETEGRLRGHDADDGVRLRVQGHGFSDHGGIGGEAFFPKRVAEDDGANARLHVGGGEKAAVDRAQTENGKEIFGHFGAFEMAGSSVTGEFLGGILKDGDGGKGSGGGADIGDIGKRDAEKGKVKEGAARRKIDEAGRMREWERAEEDGVDDREDGGVGTDAESEGEDRDEGEGGRFFEETQGKAGVAKERVEERCGWGHGWLVEAVWGVEEVEFSGRSQPSARLRMRLPKVAFFSE